MSEISQTVPVTDEELDQMIWKLERDGMTPKQLSLMRELREVRRAKGDGRDQFEEWFKFHHGEEGSIVTLHRANGGANYADPHVDLAWIAWKDSRAAMQSDGTLTNEDTMQLSGNSEQLEPVSNRDELKKGLAAIRNSGIAIDGEKILAERDVLNSPATPDGWIPVSERMPPNKPLLVCSSNGYVERTVYGFDGENWFDWNEQYVQVKTDPDELWQLLPAAPKEVG